MFPALQGNAAGYLVAASVLALYLTCLLFGTRCGRHLMYCLLMASLALVALVLAASIALTWCVPDTATLLATMALVTLWLNNFRVRA